MSLIVEAEIHVLTHFFVMAQTFKLVNLSYKEH